MAALYLDTSALLKRYVVETGSTWIKRVTDIGSGNEPYSAAIAGPEAIAALVRRSRGQRWTSMQLASALASVRFDRQNLYAVIQIDESVMRRAMDIAERHGLRGADAIHVAAALSLRDARLSEQLSLPTFVSADQEQLSAAAIEGFAVEDPTQHQ